MKKSYFITGAVYLAFGCLMLTVALFTESRLEGIRRDSVRAGRSRDRTGNPDDRTVFLLEPSAEQAALSGK